MPNLYTENKCASWDEEKFAGDISLWLSLIAPDLGAEAARNTPWRWMRAMLEMTHGYHQNPEQILSKHFDQKCSSMIKDIDIPFYSTCKHHLMTFFGTADIGYIANGQIIGLSKLARVVDCYARRLQTQETMGEQIADALMKYGKAKGAYVVLKGTHMCSCARGIRAKGNTMITSAIRGKFLNPTVRSEYLQLVK